MPANSVRERVIEPGLGDLGSGTGGAAAPTDDPPRFSESSQPPSGETPTGPELPTLAERLVWLTHLPYGWGCVLYGFLLFGFLNFMIPLSLAAAPLAVGMAQALDPMHLVTYIMGSFLMYAPHYMRMKTLETEPSISPLLENGRTGFHRLFARISAGRPQLLAWLASSAGLLGALVLLPKLFGSTWIEIPFPPGTSPFELGEIVTGVLAFTFYGLGLSSLIWAYYSVLKGIHGCGRQPLRLRPYFDDAFLGLRPLGSLALSLALAYFCGVGLLVVIVAIAPSPPIGAVIGLSGLLGALMVLGLGMFFLPLHRLHVRMLAQKSLERRKLAERFEPLFQGAPPANPTGERTDSMILETLRLDIIDRKVSAMATWPFDLRVLGQLTLIIVSVAAALITRVAFLFLGI